MQKSCQVEKVHTHTDVENKKIRREIQYTILLIFLLSRLQKEVEGDLNSLNFLLSW